MIIGDKEIDINYIVKFATFHKTDTQTYRGKVVGFTTYAVARVHAELEAIHRNMSSAVASQNLASQTFLLLKTNDDIVRPFAICWIDTTTLLRTDTATDRVLVVREVEDSNLETLLNTIRLAGYDCSIYRGKL